MTESAPQLAPAPARSALRERLLREALPVGLLVLAACVLFWRAVLLRGVFFHYDNAIQNYPFRLFFARGLAAGHLRLWTSDLFCGFPLFAESQANALYPPFLILFGLLKPWVAYNYYVVLHFAAAGVFTYALARTLDVGRAGAFIAGLAYMMAGPLLYHSHHTNIVVGVALLPLLLALMETACRRRTLPWFLAFGAATGALILGAQPQYTIYDALVCGIYLVWRLRLLGLSGVDGRKVALTAAGLGGAAALGGLLAAAQLLPTMELVHLTSRAGGGMAGVSPGVPGNLLTLLLPRAFGSPGLGSYWGSADPGLYSEVTLFLGASVLMLAVLGAWADRSRRALFFVGLGLFAFIFALGFRGSLYNVIGQLPLFKVARFPSRFAYVMALSAALLAGMGIEKLLRAPDDALVRRGAAVAVLGTVGLAVASLLVVALFQGRFFTMGRAALGAALPFLPHYALEEVSRHLHTTFPGDVARLGGVVLAGCGLLILGARRVVPGMVVAAGWGVLIFVELSSAGADFTAVTSPSIYTGTPPLAQALRGLPPGRVVRYRYNDPTDGHAQPAQYPFTQGWALDPARYAHSLDRIPPDSNLIWGIRSVSGFSPLQTLALKTLLGRPNSESTIIEFDLTHPLDLLDVRYVLTPRAHVPGGYKLLRRVGDINIFENLNAMPRAFIVHRAEPAPPDKEAVALLSAPDFDYADHILVHDSHGPLLTDPHGRAAIDETAMMAADSGDDVTVRAHLDRPGYMVLADQTYPGWRVTVDGKPGRLLRVDYVLRGVQLAAGAHEVRFTFRPESFHVGAAVSLVALAALLGGVVLCVVLRPIRPPLPEAAWTASYTTHSARLVLICGLVFIAISPLLRFHLWRDAGRELSPRGYAAEFALLKARYAAADGRYGVAYDTMRDATFWWRQDRDLRKDLALYADAHARALLKDGHASEARAVAIEALAMAPEEVRSKAPALVPLAHAPPPPAAH